MDEQNSKKWAELLSFVESGMSKAGIPGAVVGVLYGDEIHIAGLGVTNVEHPLEVTPDTLFQVGSISKTFTATLTMMLVEEGKIDLDAPVRTYLPDFKVADETASEQVTVRHLLTHTAGWPGDVFINTGAGDDAAAKFMAAMGEKTQITSFGKYFSYNNASFNLVGHLIETVTGQSYQQVLEEKLGKPLKLQHLYLDPGDVITHRFMSGHWVEPEGAQVARPWPLPRAAYPAGAVVTRAADLLAYARFHMGDGTTPDGEQLLKPESLAAMQTPQVEIWGEERMGLSWFINDTYSTRFVSHGGATNGQIAYLALVPEHQFAVAVFTNADLGRSLNTKTFRKAAELYFGIEFQDPEPLDEITEEILAPFVGTYFRDMVDVHLGLLGGRLVGQLIYKAGFPDEHAPTPPPPPPFALTVCKDGSLKILDGPMQGGRVEVFRDDSGNVQHLRSGLRLLVRAD